MLHDNDGCSAGVLVKNHRAEKFWVLYCWTSHFRIAQQH